jgi:hypothetical protein
VTHRHSQHTVCDAASGVTEEGGHPGVSVCLVSGTGSAVREVQGVFSVFSVVVMSGSWSASAVCFVFSVSSTTVATVVADVLICADLLISAIASQYRVD